MDGKVTLISGKVDSRDDEVSFLVETMEEFKGTGSHVVHIPKGTSKEKLSLLKKLFDENTGDDAVTLIFDESRKKIVPKQKISWSLDLSLQISNILM